jgi:hypothetical protein
MIATDLFRKLQEAFSPSDPLPESRLNEPLKLERQRILIPAGDTPLAVRLGRPGKTLHLLPEPMVDATAAAEPADYLLLDPDCGVGRIGGFLRLTHGSRFVLGRHDELQQGMFNYPKTVAKRHLEITYREGTLEFRSLPDDRETLLSPLPGAWVEDAILDRRRQLLKQIREIYGGPIEPLAPEEALDTLRQVNALLEIEPMRPRDDRGRPGGVIRVPDRMTPIVIGDLHAQVNNLLTLLTQNEFLEALGDGTAAMLFLGDAVHKEVDGEMEEMESSLLMMDLIFRLKLWFPQQVYYIRGNHDCFTEDVGKDGIPQGLLWDRMVRTTRGDAYKQEMDRFYDLLPYLTLSGDFVACHAAPPKSRVDLHALINARDKPDLLRELTCNRLYAANRPAGYTKGDAKRLRKALDLGVDADLFVGHTPMNRTETLWSEVGGIANHHVVFSGNLPWVGVFTRMNSRFIPLTYRSENLLPLINTLTEG